MFLVLKFVQLGKLKICQHSKSRRASVTALPASSAKILIAASAEF